MGDVKLNLDMGGLIALSNAADEQIGAPRADRIAAAAGSGHRVQSTSRAGIPGWARTRVVTDTVRAMIRERSRGSLSRAFGGGG